MRDIRRWAVYVAPRMASALARFGADWLGWDAQAGLMRDGLALPGLPRPRPALVEAARRYGLHATLKAPFPLAPDRVPTELDAAIAAVAGDFAPFPLPLALASLGGFLALVPAGPSPEIDALAAACVTRLDSFRAALQPAERARRRPDALSAEQRALLEQWGYPFVLGEYRFHMTLTGPLPDDERAAAAAALAPLLDPILAAPLMVADICLFGEDGAGRFHLLKRFPLTGTAAPA